jgi:hypothetical protein
MVMQCCAAAKFSIPHRISEIFAYEHQTQLELVVVLGENARPGFSNAYIDLIARNGAEHEAALLQALRSENLEVVEVGLGPDRDFSPPPKR